MLFTAPAECQSYGTGRPVTTLLPWTPQGRLKWSTNNVICPFYQKHLFTPTHYGKSRITIREVVKTVIHAWNPP